MSVEMVEGAWYRRRDGEIVGPLERIENPKTPRRGVAKMIWQAGGLQYTKSGGQSPYSKQSNGDLLERVTKDGSAVDVVKVSLAYASLESDMPPLNEERIRERVDNCAAIYTIAYHER